MSEDKPPETSGAERMPTTRVDDTGMVKPERSLLTIAHKGMKNLQRKLSFGEYRGKGKPTWSEQGMPVTDKGPSDEVGRKDKEKLRGIKAWILSDLSANGKPCWNFCLDCGRTDINIVSPGDHLSLPAPGATIINENRPDLDLHPGDMVMYWVCARCEKHRIALLQKPDDYSPGVLVDQYGNNMQEDEEEREIDRYERERTERMIKNMVDWIRVKIERGETPKTFQGD